MSSLFRQTRRPSSRSNSRATAHCQLNLETLEERITLSLAFGFAIGGATSGQSQSIATTTDNFGDVYITGYFSGTTQFGSITLTAQGGYDAFVAKYSPSGSPDWVADLGGAGSHTAGNGIAVDASGNVYTTGGFNGTNVNFDPNSTEHQLSSSNSGKDDNAYVSKLNSSGQYVFAVDLGYGGSAGGAGIAVDGSGNVYTTGSFNGTDLGFDPNNSDDQLTSSNSGSDDNAYVSKLNASGQYVYGVILGYGGTAYGAGIAVDASGNAYTTGTFSGTDLSFDPNLGTNYTLSSSDGGADDNAYVSKLNASGQYLFAVDLGANATSGGAGASAIAIDGSGNIFTTGDFYGTDVSFNPNGSSNQLSSSDSGTDANAYVSMLTSSGQYAFAVDLGRGGHTSGSGIAVDSSGNVYTTGYFSGTDVNFDPHNNSVQFTSSESGGDINAYVSKLNSSGQYVFAVQLGSGGTNADPGAVSAAIAVDDSGNVYATGYVDGANVNFNPFGTQNLSSASSNKVAYFLSKLTQLQIGTTLLPAGATGAYYDETISASGTGSTTFSVSNGALPNGLSLNASTGEIKGTPSSSGTFTFTISVTDSAGDMSSQTYSISIAYQSQYAGAAYSYTYAAYVDAYDAYASGKGSYNAFLYEYYADYFATYANMYAAEGNAADAQNYAYYAYYYGYYGQYYAYQDYTQSGSDYSYAAYYYGYYGQLYSYYMAEGY